MQTKLFVVYDKKTSETYEIKGDCDFAAVGPLVFLKFTTTSDAKMFIRADLIRCVIASSPVSSSVS